MPLPDLFGLIDATSKDGSCATTPADAITAAIEQLTNRRVNTWLLSWEELRLRRWWWWWWRRCWRLRWLPTRRRRWWRGRRWRWRWRWRWLGRHERHQRR